MPPSVSTTSRNMYVTFAKQGPGKGRRTTRSWQRFVDVFAPNRRPSSTPVDAGKLDSPWGGTCALQLRRPSAAKYSWEFGNGRIHAYEQPTGAVRRTKPSGRREPVVMTGSGDCASPPTTPGAGPNPLFFTAGFNTRRRPVRNTPPQRTDEPAVGCGARPQPPAVRNHAGTGPFQRTQIGTNNQILARRPCVHEPSLGVQKHRSSALQPF